MARYKCNLDYKVVRCSGYKAKSGLKMSIFLPGPCTNTYYYSLVKQYGFSSVQVFWDHYREARAAGWKNSEMYISFPCQFLEYAWSNGTALEYVRKEILNNGSILGFDENTSRRVWPESIHTGIFHGIVLAVYE
jgi:hypothetical protein